MRDLTIHEFSVDVTQRVYGPGHDLDDPAIAIGSRRINIKVRVCGDKYQKDLAEAAVLREYNLNDWKDPRIVGHKEIRIDLFLPKMDRLGYDPDPTILGPVESL